jgi:glycosyltransferase involved in cell wall biosynthesis
MRILVINWQDLKNPLAGGAEDHLHRVFSRIARIHDVTVLCSHFDGAPTEETVDGLRIVRHGSRTLFNYSVPGIYRRIRNRGFDLVVEDLNKIPFFTPLYVREPLVGIGHHLFRSSIFRQTNPVAAGYVYGMETVALRYYARKRIPFIINSPSTFNDFAAHGFSAKDLTVVYPAINHDLFRPAGVPKSPTPLVACFGRIKRYKSLDILLHALPRVLQEVPELKVVIAGDGDDRQRLERLAEDIGLTNVVKFTGYISEEQKVELLQSIWFKVATSVKEGWGLTVSEANACGTTVLASDVPGLRDAVRDGETGILFPYGDTEKLAAEMIRLLNDRLLRDRLSHNAIAFAAKYTRDEEASQTLRVLEQVVREGKRH